ncbi:hypothetical protein KI387_032809, partial [Taxus chinensis]
MGSSCRLLPPEEHGRLRSSNPGSRMVRHVVQMPSFMGRLMCLEDGWRRSKWFWDPLSRNPPTQIDNLSPAACGLPPPWCPPDLQLDPLD